MSTNGIKILNTACQGCVNCIKCCPTEAIRVIDGTVSILDDLCIDCGECLRSCSKRALAMDDDNWELIRTLGSGVAVTDPTFYSQFGSYWAPSDVEVAMHHWNTQLLVREVEDAYDVCAMAAAREIERRGREQLPLISTYCPSVMRLIQLQFPELLGRVLLVENPLEVAVAIWRKKTGKTDPVTLFSPCPARLTMVRNPIGRLQSEIQHVVSLRSVVRTLLAAGAKVSDPTAPAYTNIRGGMWAMRDGESSHIRAFSEKKIVTIAVSGLRNTMDILRELEFDRLRGVDFVECRVCDTGCIGGVATAESRFLARLHTETIHPNWEISEEKRQDLNALYETNIWGMSEPILSKQRIPLSNDLSEAMARLKNMKDIYATLPHIDCGACGRPSCQAMAEDTVRGQGDVSDCIFKLRESITSLANRIISLSSAQPHTLKGRREKNDY